LRVFGFWVINHNLFFLKGSFGFGGILRGSFWYLNRLDFWGSLEGSTIKENPFFGQFLEKLAQSVSFSRNLTFFSVKFHWFWPIVVRKGSIDDSMQTFSLTMGQK
jgi:hypothetical protein